MDIEILNAEANPDVRVIRLSGRLDVIGAQELEPQILDAAAKCEAGLVVNMEGVEFVSSAGLRIILAVRKEADAAGKPLALVHVRPLVYKIFKIAALDKVFQFFEVEDEAIQSLSS
ncbi:MAG: STAS domain-containing protein [Planctomycetes bacterium]|nr:STAS domain-containing protein [Planctomycetota bacterium]